MPTIVCLYGKAGHGKSTVAKYLVKKHGFQEIAFAGPLKLACKEIFSLTDNQLYDPVEKESVDMFWGTTPRKILQVVGTELFRNELPKHISSASNIWIRAMRRKLQTITCKNIVITDCRFEDEWKEMVSSGAITVKIVRQNYNSHISSSSSTHASETALDNSDIYTPDVMLLNNSSLENLYQSIEKCIVPLIKN